MKVLIVSSFRTGEVAEPAAHMQSAVEIVEVDRAGGLIERDVRVFVGTVRAIRRHDPDVALLDCFESMGFIAATICLLFRVPIIPRLVGDNWRTIGEEELARARTSGVMAVVVNRLSTLLNEYIYRLASGFVVVSNDLADTVARRTGCPPDRIAVVPLPMAAEPAGSAGEARRAHDIREDRVLLTVTNLNFRAKLDGVLTILEELRGTLEAQEDLGYVIAGGGFYHDRLVEEIDEAFGGHPAQDRIYPLGWVDVGDLYALADVFVYVSYLDGYPNAVLEAQASGLPVVANAAYGMLDQINDGRTGVLIDPDVPGQLSEAVDRLLADEQERDRLGESARQKVRSENDPETIGRLLDDALGGLLSHR